MAGSRTLFPLPFTVWLSTDSSPALAPLASNRLPPGALRLGMCGRLRKVNDMLLGCADSCRAALTLSLVERRITATGRRRFPLHTFGTDIDDVDRQSGRTVFTIESTAVATHVSSIQIR